MSMSPGMTIADFVQQVYYAVYKVRLDVRQGVEGAFHSKTDKFKEVVMEANFVLQELQKEQDWNWLRDRWEMGISCQVGPHGRGIQEFTLPDDVYKVCTGYNDAIRLHRKWNPNVFMEVPFVSPRSGNHHDVAMFDQYGNLNAPDNRVRAFVVGDTITFTRPWRPLECDCLIETDVIRRMEPLHICDDSCPDNCPEAYKDLVFTEIPDPYYMVVKTARKRAEGDPSAQDRIESLTNDETKMLSAMRENDSAHTAVDTYRTIELGYLPVL